MLEMHAYPVGPLATNCYLLTREGKEEAALVDAPPDAWRALTPILKHLKKRITDVFLTHGHWDHMGDAALFQQAGAVVHAHEGDLSWIKDPTQMGFYVPGGLNLHPCTTVATCGEGPIVLAGLSFQVWHTPGHSRGSVVLYAADDKKLFSGDTLFANGVGRTDLPGGSWRDLQDSIQRKLFVLPGDTAVYPGHGQSTTIGAEKV